MVNGGYLWLMLVVIDSGEAVRLALTVCDGSWLMMVYGGKWKLSTGYTGYLKMVHDRFVLVGHACLNHGWYSRWWSGLVHSGDGSQLTIVIGGQGSIIRFEEWCRIESSSRTYIYWAGQATITILLTGEYCLMMAITIDRMADTGVWCGLTTLVSSNKA